MLIAALSLKGSPGVTTFSVVLGARWPETDNVTVIEADPSGGDIATRYSLPTTPGLVGLAANSRRSTTPELLEQHTQHLPGGLAVVVAPAGAEQARAALITLTADGAGVLAAAARAPGSVVIADCGRCDPDSPAIDVVRAADAVVVLTRPAADDLAHLAARLTTVTRWCPHPSLVLVGDGYPASEITRELGIPVLGRIPDDRRGAAVLRGIRGGRRRVGRSPLARAAARLASVLHPQVSAPSADTADASSPPVAPVPHATVATAGTTKGPAKGDSA